MTWTTLVAYFVFAAFYVWLIAELSGSSENWSGLLVLAAGLTGALAAAHQAGRKERANEESGRIVRRTTT